MPTSADYYVKPSNPSDGDVAYASDVSNVNNETDLAFTQVKTDMNNAFLQSAASQAWAVGGSASGDYTTPVAVAYGGDASTTFCSKYWAIHASASVSGTTSLVAGAGLAISTTGSPTTATFSTLENRNRWINGEHMVDQRNTGTAVSPTASPTFVTDRHYIAYANPDTVVVSGQQASGLTTSRNSMKVTVGTSGTIAANAFISAQGYKFRGYDVADLAGDEVTVSFTMKTNLPSGSNVAFAVLAGDASRSWVKDVVVTEAGVAQDVSVTLTLESGTTTITDSTTGIGLRVVLGTIGGANYQTSGASGGSWAASGTARSLCTSATTAWTASAGYYLEFGACQLRKGDANPPIERHPYATYLEDCKPYYQEHLVGMRTGFSITTGAFRVPFLLSPEMIKEPTLGSSVTFGALATLVTETGGTDIEPTGVTEDVGTSTIYTVDFDDSGVGYTADTAGMVLDAAGTSKLTFNAEL